jgi:hypothetical protein
MRIESRRTAILALLLAPLLACALASATAHAQARTVELPYGLGGSAAWRENILYGVNLWVIADENARRALLLGRCTALDRAFPAHPAPAMVAASNEVLLWWIGRAHTELPPEPIATATREVFPVVVRHAFNAQELAAWEALRTSEKGRRGLAIHEVEMAMPKVADQLVDINTGRYWDWPLARLTRLADAHKLRAEMDAAFDKVLGSGSSAQLRNISLVPGETRADENFLKQVSDSGEALADAFILRLPAADKEAYERLGDSAVLQRWGDIAQSLPRFATGPAGRLRKDEPSVPSTIPELCKSLGLKACEPGGELHNSLTRYRAAFDNAPLGATFDLVKRVVRGLPASGCP